MYEKSKRNIRYFIGRPPDIGIYPIDMPPFDTIITLSNIDDEELKNIIIKEYKWDNLWKHSRPADICGLIQKYPLTYRRLMIIDLEYRMEMQYALDPTIKYIYYKKRSLKQLYQLWVKL